MSNDMKKNTVIISGDAKIANIADIHKKIRDSISDCVEIEIDCESIEGVDLLFIQLLAVARRAAARSGGRLRLSSPAPPAMMRLLERGGFISGFGEQSTDAAFWMAREGR